MRKLATVPRGAPNAYAQIGRRVQAHGASVPPPVEGWDAVSPIAAMSPKRAFRLDNWFPQPSWVELRKGFVEHVNTGSDLPVETLAAYQGVASRKLFAASDDTIYDVTSSGAASASVTGLSNARFQYINFATSGGNFLYMVNGADIPQYYDGSTWATATITGIDPTAIIGVNGFKERLFFILSDSSAFAYLPVDSIQGAANTYELGGFFTMGGFIMAMGTWSVDAGDGPDDYAVFVSSRGEVAIFRGTDPDNAPTDWALVGVFNMGAPIGRRCLTQVGADVAIICIDGVVPLSKVMIFERAAVAKVTLTQNIQRVMNESARAYGDNFGWQLMSYPRGTRAILNIPVSENAEQRQYVMNTLNGAWCRFTGMNANCWELLNDIPFFGGNDGVVYQADEGGSDAGAQMRADMMTAYNYFGERGNLKRWMMCRPLLTTDGVVNPGIAFNVDFQTDAPISIPNTEAGAQALWDVALWDVGLWAGLTTQTTWTSVAGLGYCASIRMVVDIVSDVPLPGVWGEATWGGSPWGVPTSAAVTLQVNGFDLTMETGAFV
jgi:hypothetical protein